MVILESTSYNRNNCILTLFIVDVRAVHCAPRAVGGAAAQRAAELGFLKRILQD